MPLWKKVLIGLGIALLIAPHDTLAVLTALWHAVGVSWSQTGLH